MTSSTYIPQTIKAEEVPGRDYLRSLENWPVTHMGVDVAKLERFLSLLLSTKVPEMQVNAIRNYIANVHPIVPILDLDFFLHYLATASAKISHIVSNLVTILKFYHRNPTVTLEITRDTWNNTAHYPYPNTSRPLMRSSMLLDAVVAQLIFYLSDFKAFY